jgi:hypothetical protein
MSEIINDPELKALEAALGSLTPRPGTIDRDRLMYRAGQLSVPRRTWAWPVATFSASLVAVSLAAILIMRPVEHPIGPVARTTMPPAKEANPIPSGLESPRLDPATPGGPATIAPAAGYLLLRQEVLRWGIDNLPPLPVAPTVHDAPLTLDGLLGANSPSTQRGGSSLTFANSGGRS